MGLMAEKEALNTAVRVIVRQLLCVFAENPL